MLAIGSGTGVNMGLFLVSAAGLIISAIMLRSTIFSKVTAYEGILANVIGLAYFIGLAFVPAAGFILLVVSGLLSVIWMFLVGLRLYRLGQGVSKEEVNRN